jgi:Protein of unknown function (DUF2384)
MRSMSIMHELRAEIGEPALSNALQILKDEILLARRTETATMVTLARLRAHNAAALAVTRAQILTEALSSDQVRHYVRRTRPVVNRMAHDGTLLAIADGRALRFPRWQFDDHSEDGLVPGFRRVLSVMDASPFRKATWFVTPNPRLGGRKPIELLHDGDVDDVLEEAKGLASG